MKKVSIIIPVFNEGKNISLIQERVNKVMQQLPAYELELLFIDDGSSDSTLDEILKLTTSSYNVNYISFSRNFGHQNALKAGLDHASGDAVISMDGDLQHPPELIEQLLKKWEEGFQVVYTVRKEEPSLSFFKKNTSSLFYSMMNMLSEIKVPKGAADFRLLDRLVVNVLVQQITEYNLFYRGLVAWVGYKSFAIEYFPETRKHGKTKYSIRKMLSFAINGLTSFSIRPLQIAVLTGICISALSFFYGLYAVLLFVFTNRSIQGWTSVILSVLFIGGLQLLFTGIIGEYLGKMYQESKGRPHYLISKSNIKKG